MKQRISAMILFLFISAISVLSQNLPDNIQSSFRKGEAPGLSQYLANTVQYITTTGQEQLTKEQVILNLTVFFADNKPSDFKILHQSIRNESGFMIAKLSTKNIDFRIHCLFKINNKQYLINQIRIEKF